MFFVIFGYIAVFSLLVRDLITGGGLISKMAYRDVIKDFTEASGNS